VNSIELASAAFYSIQYGKQAFVIPAHDLERYHRLAAFWGQVLTYQAATPQQWQAQQDKLEAAVDRFYRLLL
jgi:hypothetical protein